jgi:ribonuclease HI
LDLIIHVDGGARGNPGPAGAGVVIHDSAGNRLYEAGFFLGHQTNNVAEYTALIRALQRTQRLAAKTVTIHSDSELLVRQITGAYHVKAAALILLHQEAQLLLLKTPRWHLRHVRRAENARADELANLAMDQRRDVVVFDAELQGATAADAPPTDAPSATTEDAAKPPARRKSTKKAGSKDAPAATPHPGPRTPAVQITMTQPPAADTCPVGGSHETTFTVEGALPAGLCIHAAHAILPTLLAVLGTEPHEFAAIPTLTVRCARPSCGATFQISPLRGPNGSSH